jgi:DNA-binding transcriptional ArsR family regulator
MSIDETIRALADPTRREILRLLREGDLTAGDIASRFPITGASVSHHLSVLKEAELVQAVREGRTIVYSLNSTVLQDFVGELLGFLGGGGNGRTEEGDEQ